MDTVTQREKDDNAVFAAIEKFPGERVNKLADSIGMKNQTFHKTAKRLLRKGLVVQANLRGKGNMLPKSYTVVGVKRR